MRKFNFSRTLQRYSEPYFVVRQGEGVWNADGVYQPAASERVPYAGSIQPIGIKLMQLEGGRYTMDDRILFTLAAHEEGEVIEYQGKQYTIDGGDPRDYSDVQKYTMKRVTTHDPVP